MRAIELTIIDSASWLSPRACSSAASTRSAAVSRGGCSAGQAWLRLASPHRAVAAWLAIRCCRGLRSKGTGGVPSDPGKSRRPASAASGASAGAASWPRWLGENARLMLREAWSEVRALVQVSRIDDPDAALLAPEQAFFVRENVKLRLLNARLALLSRQYDIAQADLRDAQSMIDRYFDRSSRRVVAASEQVRQLAGQARQVALPRPEATLAALATAVAGR